MPRLPYTPEDIAAPSEFVSYLRDKRGGKLLDVDRMLLHSPALAAAWDGFFGGIKMSGMLLSARLRELVACSVGSLNGARYQFEQHGAAFLAAGGTAEQLLALEDPIKAVDDAVLFDDIDRAVLRLSTEMTRAIHVADPTFAAVQAALGSEQAVVEVVGVIAGYNLVSRFLVALGVGADPTS